MAMLLPYSRLDPARAQIRLLRVEPTLAPPPKDPLQTAFFDDTPVRCSIEVVSLDDNPKFVALSYAWGNRDETAPITINGIEVVVTRSLRRALVLHSSMQPEYPIWADAVCINQANLGEKSSQIRLMSRVYEQAANVFCWLGLATPHIREYLAWGTWLDGRSSTRSQNRKQLSRWWRWTYFQFKIWRPLRQTKEEHLYSVASVLKGQADFIGLPYFERMWTLQESTLPSSERIVFAVGPYLVPGFDPRTFAGIYPPASVAMEITSLKRQLRHPCSPAPAVYTEVFNDAALLQGTDTMYRATLHAMLIADQSSSGGRDDCDSRGHELGRLLVATGDRKCHDPRDKIFALLSLVKLTSPLVHPYEDTRERVRRVQGSKDRWLAIDYTKQAELVIRDALYYVYGAENGTMFYKILKLYQPRREALLKRQRSKAQKEQDCRNGLQPRRTSEDGENVYSCRGDYVCPTWLPDMTKPNHPESSWVRLPVFEHEPLRGICWDTREDLVPSSREDRLFFRAKHVGSVTRVIEFPDTTAEILDILTILAYSFTLHDTTITAPINPAASHTMAASYYGLPPFPYPIEQRSDLFVHKACHDLVSRITDRKHLYNRFCRAVLSDTYKAHPVAARVFEENLFFWLTIQYCLESLRHRPDQETMLRTQNLRMAEEVALRVRGRALVLLESGNFAMCTGAVEVGDVVVLANCFQDTLLLRPDCLACRREDGACDGHSSQAEVWDGAVFLQTHLLVDYPYVDRLRGKTSYDKVFAEKVCERDELMIVLG